VSHFSLAQGSSRYPPTRPPGRPDGDSPPRRRATWQRTITFQRAFKTALWVVERESPRSIVFVDYGTQRRVPKASARWYSEVIRRNGLAGVLRQKDWPAFARAYNGPAYRVNRYDERMVRKTKSDFKLGAADFERQMAIEREVMERDWVALRALALADQYPELDVETRIEMARKQAASRKASQGYSQSD
jgi:hypothetical protein